MVRLLFSEIVAWIRMKLAMVAVECSYTSKKTSGEKVSLLISQSLSRLMAIVQKPKNLIRYFLFFLSSALSDQEIRGSELVEVKES